MARGAFTMVIFSLETLVVLIHGNHIDVFIGIDAKSPFAWITSNSNSQIDYRIVPDADIKEALLELHL